MRSQLWRAPVRRRLRPIVGVLLGAAALLATAGPAAATRAPASPGHTVTFALQPGNTPNYALPLVSSQYFTIVNEDQFEYLMYRPLYWYGLNGTTAFNPGQSLAEAPAFSVNRQGDSVATIQLRSWHWSDGVPVTTRDVELWMNLLRANRQDWGVYVPGAWPDIIHSIRYLSATRFQITFTRRYNTNWLFYDELSQIFPLPQRTWDRTGASRPVGNYDLTPAGSVAVYRYLNSQARDLSSYGSNPLWKVVDGPWVLHSYAPATGYTVFSRNFRYPGPSHPGVTRFVEVPFTSDSAEFDALRSGALSIGYLPQQDLSQTSYLAGHGYRTAPWWEWLFNYISINYRNPTDGPMFAQLYLRQAMQTLIDQPSYVHHIYKGLAVPTYGPIPTATHSRDASPQETHNPYPYSVTAARALLRSHGWTVRPNGVDTCSRPGSGSSRCGAGIRAGARLAFQLLYPSGSTVTAAEMEALRSADSEAGIDLTVTATPYSTLTTTIYSCDPATHVGCGWQIADTGGWEYYAYPSGEQLFKTGGSGNSGGYSNPTADRLIQQTLTTPGLTPLYRYQNYLARDLPVLYLPTPPYQLTVYARTLRGVLPQDPSLNVYPETLAVAG
ncbi:MAG TPA: ABC transporter substrate-binding protein [Verrucomicrobiae bacterium]|nr:ABC transporter substrate-binding protein [Verrucomicrobiae bacterium]